MNSIGFRMIKERWKPGGKVGYWLFEKEGGQNVAQSKANESTPNFSKKVVLREGARRNNFCILF
jgi:25S rRNA (adenine2142-N1)-methyltransferase